MSNNSSLNTSLDTQTYPVDYVSDLFNAIDWGSRVKTKRREDHWIDPDSWDKHSYTMKYLEYRVEEGQIDLTNPFHIEESNKIRTRLEKKKTRGNKEVTELNMMTEGLKAVEDGGDHEGDDKDDDDYFDEYGNIKENNKSKDKTVKVHAAPDSDKSKDGKPNKHPQARKGNPGWKDLDSMSEDNSERKPKERAYVKSAIDVQAASKVMFPRESSLSWPEQEKFLFNERLVREGRLGPGSGNGNQWIFYQNFKELVVEEQQEFAQFTRDVYTPLSPTLCDGHRKYVHDHRTVRLRRPLSLPRYWDKLKEARLVGVNPEQSCAMVLEQTLLELGDKPRAKIPELIRNNKQLFGHQLPQQYLKLMNTIPPDPNVMPGSCNITRVSDPRSGDHSWSAQSSVNVDRSKYYHKESCIEDHNCSLLAQHLVPDVIISSSALKCLFDNHKPGLARTWDIPFIVRTFKSEVDVRKVVIFGKPLPQREVSDEDLSLLAHKVAAKVKLFQREWELKPKPRSDVTEKRQSPGEDLFGDAEVDIQDLEVFGNTASDKEKTHPDIPHPAEEPKADTSGDKMEIDIGLDDVMLQVDGVDDSDSDNDNLVISDKVISPPRRSSRLRQKSTSSNASTKTPSRPSETAKTVDSVDDVPVEEKLDFEPEEESPSSSESECEDAPMAKALFLEKLKMNNAAGNPDTSFNPPLESTHLENTSQVKSREDDEGNDDSSSSSSEDEDGGQLLLKKKLLMSQSQPVQDDSNTEDAKGNPDIDQDVKVAEKVTIISTAESQPQEDQMESSSDSDDDGGALLKKKMAMVQNQSWATVGKDSTKSEADSSDSEGVKRDKDEVVSPKKKLRKLSSGSEDEFVIANDPLQSKLIQLGRENANLDKLKQKITTSKKLSSMKERMEEKTQVLAERRQTRANKRNATKDSSKTNEQLFGSDHEDIPTKSKSPSKSPSKKVKSKIVKEDSSDSETEDKGRFNKFARSDASKQKSDFLGNLLTGQDKLLHSDHRRSYHSAPPPHDNIPDLSKPVVAPGLPPLETFKPPIPGNNVTFRMWKLYDKASGSGRVLRCVVRSAVGGVTQAGTMVTPSVKLEHQTQFGAERVTGSQASRDWMATLIRPGSMLARLRLGQDSKIAMVEEKTLAQVTHECRAVGVDPARQLVNVYNIFSELSSLSAGQYLLHHSSKTGAFCNVYAASADNTAGGLDLHKMYSTIQPEDSVPTKVPYSPIDVDILTPWHQVHGRVPGTFEPSGERGASGRGRGRGGRGGRGNNRGGNKNRGK